jgi:hypothetical protein
MTWIGKLLTSTAASESPRKYWYWAGLTAISAVVNNKVYLDKFLYKLYPNIFVLLVGKSGIRKGPPVSLAKDLVEAVNNTRVISGRVSIQAVISELKNATTKEGGGPPILDAIGFLTSSEFASFIIQDPAALTILTDLYDGGYHKSGWESMTKGGGKEKLKNVCLTMIGASNEVHFKEAVPANALGGGFVARCCIIHAEKKSGSNPLTDRPELTPDVGELAQHLRALSKLKGEFVWSREGKDRYNQWYEQFGDSQTTDSTGTLDRLHDHVLKTAMLISLSRGTDLTLSYSDLNEAIMACQDFIPGARKVTMGGAGASASAPGTAVLIRALLSRKETGYGAPRRELGITHWQDFDMMELDKIAESLQTAGALIQEMRNTGPGGGKELWYQLTPKMVEQFNARIKQTEEGSE